MFELLTPNEMAIADQTTIKSGTAGIELMKNAGSGVADVVKKLGTNSKRITILAGPGNNGGDGFVVASILKDYGYTVQVGLLGEVQNIKGDAKLAFDDLKETNISISNLTPEIISEGDIIIDAIFGAGLCREIDGDVAKIIDVVNNSENLVVSVDLPSGIDGKTGKILGGAIKASETVTFFRKKPGHLLFPGRAHCGNVSVIDIGIPNSVLKTVNPNIYCNQIEFWEEYIPRFKLTGHKYNRGHSLVFSGPIQSTGAARLCAQAALRVGAGLVTLASPQSALVVNAAHLTAVMIKSVENIEESKQLLADNRINSIAIGPGFGVGERTQEFVSSILEGDQSVVLDADSLTSFSANPTKLFTLIRKSTTREVVLTPHTGEFFRLFGESLESENKVECAKQAAKLSQAVVVFKGADTIIADPDGKCAINANAPSWLATAGSGDVLAGIICGLIAQSVPAFYAACMGVWIHGEIANKLGPGIISEDLILGIQSVISELYQVSRNQT